jgi:nitroreductase
MLSCAGSIFGHTGKPNRWTQHDTGMATLSMALQAVDMGLILHQMGGFDVDKARAAFDIPAEYTPMAMIAVGYQAEPDVLDEETEQKELKARARKPVEERFYEGGWGKGVKT